MTNSEKASTEASPWIRETAVAPDFQNVAVEDLWPNSEVILREGGPACQERMQVVMEYVLANYSKPSLCVGSVASDLNFNASYLSRTFKYVTGIGLASFIQYVRVAAAKEILKDDYFKVKEAAKAVGFNSVLTMNRAFHRLESTTAGQFRRIR
jgi:AraC-like DNA-binding protein